MDGNDGLGTRSDFSLEVLRIDIQCVVDIISMQSSRAVRYEDFSVEKEAQVFDFSVNS